MRYKLSAGILLPLLLTACASGFGDEQVTIATAANGQEFSGANCTVQTNSRAWNVTSPVTMAIPTNGDLRIVCSKPGYRTAELRMPPIGQSGSNVGVGMGGGSGGVGVGLGFSLPVSSGGGNYPPRILVNMSPS
jgi:hypothetical protein